MKPTTVESVRQAVRGAIVCGARDSFVTGVSTDSRNIAPGDLFVALIGDKFDGHDFIDQALAAGACGVLYSRDFPISKVHTRNVCLKVADTLVALGDLARAYRRAIPATVVAVTGSNGKTTTKEMIRHILDGRLETVASPASFNNFIGVPLTLFRTDVSTRVAVLEMGTNHPGEIARLAEIAAPDIGVITNVGRSHLEGFSTIEGVAAAKAELLHSLAPGAVAILNADDPLVMKMRTIVPDRVFTFGLSATADVFGSRVDRDEKGFRFFINDAVPAHLAVPGAHNVANALAAVAVCRRLGLDLNYIAGRLESFSLPPMRLQEHLFHGALIINDSYNANPESMARAIDELAASKAARRFFVFADMLELGAHSAALHRELGEKAAAASFDFYWAVGSEAGRAVKSAVAAGVHKDRARFFDSIKDLGLALVAEIKDGDVVLVKGSRAMGLERVLDYLK